MSASAPESGAAPSLAAAAMRGLCPRCGRAPLFAGPVQFHARCEACGLDFTRFNVGDGPAAFLILLVGAIVAVGAILLDQSFSPPWWVHLVWIPVGAGLTIAGLRVGKAALLAQEFRYQAGEGRRAD